MWDIYLPLGYRTAEDNSSVYKRTECLSQKILRKLPKYRFGLDPWSRLPTKDTVNLQKHNAYCHQSRNWARVTWHQSTADDTNKGVVIGVIMKDSALNRECCSSGLVVGAVVVL